MDAPVNQSNFQVRRTTVVYQKLAVPMHQTDSLPGKHTIAWKFKVGLCHRSPRYQHGSEGMLDPASPRRKTAVSAPVGRNQSDRFHAGQKTSSSAVARIKIVARHVK